MDTPIREAVCHCGSLKVVCEGAPRKVSMCHCPDCQRRTGSAFSVAVFYERDQVRVAGRAPSQFTRPSASGSPVTFYFCGQCGSNLYWAPERMPDLLGVAAGAFADPDFPAPQQSVWTKDKHTWLSLPEDMTQFDVAPPPRPQPDAG